MKFMTEHPAELEKLTAEMDRLGVGDDVDLSSFDFASLASTIKQGSSWVIQLENMDVDASGNTADPSQIHLPGFQPYFMIYCYDDKTRYRVTDNCKGLPNSNTVLKSIQRAIAKPIPPLKPCLPWFFLVSVKLKQHEPTIRPFLDSLPSPFHWRFETREEAEQLNDSIFETNQYGIRFGLESASKSKSIGNAAFARKDRSAAVMAYSDAIDSLIDALCQKPDIQQEKDAKRQLAICYSNRAAAYLIPGPGMDASKALKDGEAAEHQDPSYAKSYVRQATASKILGQMDAAQDAISRALRRPDLENDSGLVDRLIELQTDGKGLPQDENAFKTWILDVMINDKKSAKRIYGIKGEWGRRCNEQLAKWKRD